MTSFAPNLDALLAPIPGDSPSGPSLRYEGTYDRIRDARRHDDPSLPRGVWERPLEQADWSEVAQIAESALATRSKDLILAGWLTEAWIHRHGFEGLRAGLELWNGLTVSFWDSIHPPLDPDDPEVRVAPYVWLDEKLLIAVRGVALSEAPNRDRQVAWQDWLAARHHARGQEETENSETSAFRRAIAETPRTRIGHLTRLLDESRGRLEEIEAFLDEACGEDAPGFNTLGRELREIEAWLRRNVELDDLEAAPADDGGAAEDTDPHTDTDTDEEQEGHPMASDGPLQLESRADAYRQLARIADFLVTIEPHSPTPYLIRRAAAWGDLTLSELYGEFAREGLSLEAVCRLLAIHPPDSGGGG